MIVPTVVLPAINEYAPGATLMGPVTMAPPDMLPAVSGFVDILMELHTIVPTVKLPAVKGFTPALSPVL